MNKYRFSITILLLTLLGSFNTQAEEINKEIVGSGIPAANVNKSLHDQLPTAVRESGVLKIATDAHYPPCQSFASDNKTIIGYEPDLWNAISQKLGVTYKVDSIAFAGLIPGVESGRYDIASECISDNPEREKKVNFVVDAYATGAVYTLQENKTITSDPKSVCGLNVGIQQGFDFTKVVNEVMTPHCEAAGLKKITVNEYPSGESVLLALYSGRVDFVLNNLAAVESIKASAPRPIRIETNALLPKYYNGMVVGKENMALANVLLAALKEIKADGSYARIMAKWSISPLAIEEPGINLATTKPLSAPKP